MFPYVILEDIISKEKQNVIEEHMFSGDINWQMTRNIHFRKYTNPEVDISDTKKLVGFKHLIHNTEKHFELFVEIAENVGKRLKWQVHINHIRGAMFPNITFEETTGIPHIDFRDSPKHKIILYYVNDIDGDTVLFKNKSGDTPPEKVLQKEELTKMISVSPKKGRCVIFDGDRYHATGRPKNDFRCVLNYNIGIIE
tara:strand:+ start:4166 stop:4756 length:591 start_codon:yes stop_codon:yes gene_type:complete